MKKDTTLRLLRKTALEIMVTPKENEKRFHILKKRLRKLAKRYESEGGNLNDTTVQ